MCVSDAEPYFIAGRGVFLEGFCQVVCQRCVQMVFWPQPDNGLEVVLFCLVFVSLMLLASGNGKKQKGKDEKDVFFHIFVGIKGKSHPLMSGIWG